MRLCDFSRSFCLRSKKTQLSKQDYPGHPMVRLLGTRTKWKASQMLHAWCMTHQPGWLRLHVIFWQPTWDNFK